VDIYTNYSSLGKVLKNDFIASISVTDCLTIATGYIDEKFLRDIKPLLVAAATRGSCKILVGMIFHSGVTKNQKILLTELHDELSACNSCSGVFISRNEYHGKVYLCETNQDKTVYLGSSNLSAYGFYRRLECTVRISNGTIVDDLITYLNYLFSKETTNSLNDIELKTKKKGNRNVKPSNLLSDYAVSKTEFDNLPDYVSEQNIELRVEAQPNSSLNLYFDKGRKNSKGQYVPRPWYEVELTTAAKDRANPNYPTFASNSTQSESQSGSFWAYINEKTEYFKIAMRVHSDSGKNISSARESGGRETLGYYIKGKLQSAGVLNEGDRITPETLELYERDYITFKKIDESRYILEF
jgi:HKD family nuclease